MNFYAVFRIPTVREFYAKLRFNFLKSFKGLRVDKDLLNVNKTTYSRGALEKYVSIAERINFLVSAVESSRRIKRSDLLLSLGPRFEDELFGFRAIGYKRHNIFALDSYSYSRLISCGNMHRMNYLDSFFDIVVGGWVLAYSDNPIKAMSEIYRVTKAGGLAVLSWDIPPESDSNSLDYEDILLVSVYGNSTPLSTLKAAWEIKSLFIGNISWSSDRRIVLVVLQKPFSG